MKKNLTLWIAVFSGLVLATLATSFYWSNRELKTASPRKGPLIESVYGLGTVVATRMLQLKVSVSLQIRKLHVKEGDAVQAGAPLVSFDDGPVLKAPFSGTVTQILLREGEIVSPNAPIMTLMDLSELYMEVSLEQQAALRIRKNQPASVTFESLRGKKWAGKVDSLFPRDGQFIVRIGLSGFPEGILPAMTADVAIEAGRRENVLQIPITSISNGKVVRIRNGKKQKIEVQLGVTDGEWAELLSGEIEPSDQIVIRGK